MMQVQEGIGGNPNMIQNTPMVSNKVYKFSGQSINFEKRSSQTTQLDGIDAVKSADVHLVGEKVAQWSCCCLTWTIIFGSILIFPLFFMCCDWWKKCMGAHYVVALSTYRSLETVMRIPNLQNLCITVVDNECNQEKVKALQDVISKKKLKTFTFINNAGMYDSGNDEYSKYFDRMGMLKNLSTSTDFRWQYDMI